MDLKTEVFKAFKIKWHTTLEVGYFDMERMQFDVDGNMFKCVECEENITVKSVQKKPRPVTCGECGTEYMVAKNAADGMAVTVVTESEPELVTHTEEELEEKWEEDPDYDEEE